jgi:hypothetical protein
MHRLIEFYWDRHIRELERELPRIPDEQEEQELRRRIGWMRATRMAVVVSEEQGEVEKFRRWELDIEPHRRPMKEGMELPEAISLVRAFLLERGASLDGILDGSGFGRNAAISAAKEAANENDETRKRFEIMCRAVFSKFKACINAKEVNDYRKERDAINIVYKSLQEDREQADIAAILQQLHMVVDEAILPQAERVAQDGRLYDISRIDFERLRREFEHSPAKRTTVQNLKSAIERRLARLLRQNPLRTDLQRRYEEIVAESTRDAVKQAIRDFLWNEATGLPVNRYSNEDVRSRADEVYLHIHFAYPRLPSPVYESAGLA